MPGQLCVVWPVGFGFHPWRPESDTGNVSQTGEYIEMESSPEFHISGVLFMSQQAVQYEGPKEQVKQCSQRVTTHPNFHSGRKKKKSSF